jgi:large subunit ribosomal protein L29
MKAVKWRDLSDDEVRQRARELTEEIFNLRFQLSMGVAKNPSRLGLARRDLARAKTVLGERGATGGIGTGQPAAPLIVGERPAPPAPSPTPARRRGAQRRAASSTGGRRPAESRRAPTAGRRTARATRKKG